jgi:hypothetical protein
MTRDQLLAYGRPIPRAVELPGGGRVHLLPLSAAQRASVLERAKSDPSSVAYYALTLSLCDEHGARLFGDDEYPLIGELLAGLVDQLAAEVLEHGGLAPKPQA